MPQSFDAQAFDHRADFFAKISTYQLWYNVARKNGSRGYLSPLDLLARKNLDRPKKISPKIFLLHPIALESLLPPSRGHDVPRRAGTTEWPRLKVAVGSESGFQPVVFGTGTARAAP